MRLFLSAMILILLSCTSCRSVKKLFDKEQKSSHSTQQVKEQFNQVVKLEDHSTTVKRDSLKALATHTYQRKITIEGVAEGELIIGEPGKKFWDSLHHYNRIIVEENGVIVEDRAQQSEEIRNDHINRQEQIALDKSAKTDVKTENKSVHSSKEQKSIHWLIPAGFVVLLLGSGVVMYLKGVNPLAFLIGLFKLKKQNN